MNLSNEEIDMLFQTKWQDYVDSFDMNCIPEHPFSPAFEKKMEKMIRKQRRIENHLPSFRMVGKVAVIVVICCTIVFSGLMTVEAFRERMIYLWTQAFSTHTKVEISTEGYDEADFIPLEPENLPEEMMETERQETDGSRIIQYQNSNGNFLMFIQRGLSDEQENGTLGIDTEDASVEHCSIGNQSITRIKKEGTIKLIWNEKNSLITIYSDLSWEQLEPIAENLILQNN